MIKITFSSKEISKLQKNPNVQRVSEKSITYTDAFKNRFIDEYQVASSLARFLRRMALIRTSLA